MKTHCIIVTYYPNIEHLNKMCTTLLQNNVQIILVDNSEKNMLHLFSSKEHITVLPLHFNSGIAHAQNVGINKAITDNANIIVFFDQDSEITPDFLSTLTSPIIVNNPMIVSPISVDSKNGSEYPSFKFNKLGLLKKVYGKGKTEPYLVDVIISSGTAATKEVFEIAGLMDEDFFIDYVDTEWAIRCRKKHIPIQINPLAVMEHSIGIEDVNMGIIKTTIHSPARTYYKVRNAFLFIRKKNVPFILGIKEIAAALIHQFAQLFYVKNKKAYFKSYVSAIYDGITGVKGAKNKNLNLNNRSI